MKASQPLGADDPSTTDDVEAYALDDPDVQFVESYVYESVLLHTQRRSIALLKRDQHLFSVAQKLSEVPEGKQRFHPLFCALRSTQDRLCVKAYLFYKHMVRLHTERLRGEKGEHFREEYQRALRLGDGI